MITETIKCDECKTVINKEFSDYLLFIHDQRVDFCCHDCFALGIHKICKNYGMLQNGAVIPPVSTVD